MADQKISELTAITGANTADDDLLVIVDTSTGETKKITLGELEAGIARGDITFGDNNKAIFGAGSDLQIYHDGSNSYISDTGIGDLYIKGSTYVAIQDASGNNTFAGQAGGASYLYYAGSGKLNTTSTGIDVTGTATMDGLTVDTAIDTSGITLNTPYGVAGEQYAAIRWNNSSFAGGDSEIRNVVDGTASVGSSLEFHTEQTGTGTLTERLKLHNNGDISFYEDTGTTAKFFWDASAESLGIGTSSPITAHGTQLTVYGSSNGGVSLSSSTNASAISQNANDVYFDVSRDGAAGNLIFRRSSSFNESMRLDNTGSLLVGTTNGYASISTTTTESGHVLSPTAGYAVSRAGAPILGNRIGSDGTIVDLRKDGTTVGSIGTLGGALNIGSASGVGVMFNTNQLEPTTGSTARQDATKSLGSSTYRFKDLYLSGGVYLGGTGAANHLDDYEEGTWTPTLLGSAGGSGTLSISQATYIKVGASVFVTAYFNVTSAGTISGAARIGGLPFGASNYSPASTAYTSITSLDEATIPIGGYSETGGSHITLVQGGSTSLLDVAYITGSGSIMISCTYYTTA